MHNFPFSHLLQFRSPKQIQRGIKGGQLFWEVNCGHISGPHVAVRHGVARKLFGFEYLTSQRRLYDGTPHERKHYIDDFQNTSWKGVFTKLELAKQFHSATLSLWNASEAIRIRDEEEAY